MSEALADGYTLHGAPAVTFDGERVIVAQAVVLRRVRHQGGARVSYAGDVEPEQAYAALAQDEHAVLVDVRTTAEWTYVGVPDLSGLGKQVLCLEWQRFPDGAVNDQFVAELRDAGLPEGAPVYFICRSGVRSVAAAEAATAAGIGPAYNVAARVRGTARRVGPAASPAGRTRDCPGGKDERARGMRPDTLAVRGGLDPQQLRRDRPRRSS